MRLDSFTTIKKKSGGGCGKNQNAKSRASPTLSWLDGYSTQDWREKDLDKPGTRVGSQICSRLRKEGKASVSGETAMSSSIDDREGKKGQKLKKESARSMTRTKKKRIENELIPVIEGSAEEITGDGRPSTAMQVAKRKGYKKTQPA